MSTPHRIVSLSPNVSMILFALGADTLVVGRTQDCLRAIQQYLTVWRLPQHTVASRLQHWQALPVVGVWPLADHESIKTLRPEAILTSGSGPFGVHDAQTLGVEPQAMFHFDTRTLHDLEQQVQQIGLLLGKTVEAAGVLSQLASKRDEAKARQRQRAVPPTVLFEYCVCIQYDADPDRRVATIAIVEPDYFANRKLVKFFGGQLVPVSMDYLGAEQGAGIDLEQLEVCFRSGVKVLIFSNPNNPTGAVYTHAEVTAIAHLAEKYNAFVIVDQLYSRQIFEGCEYTHLRGLSLMPSENLLTIIGPSKTESLSGFPSRPLHLARPA